MGQLNQIPNIINGNPFDTPNEDTTIPIPNLNSSGDTFG